MSKEFIEAQKNRTSLQKAAEQQEQLAYFITSKLQDNRVDEAYLKAWAERKFQTNDYFLNWVKSIFKAENFLLFFKYLRYPLPSARIVKNRIEPQLRRVFNAEDADYNYEVSGVDKSDYIDIINPKQFNKEIFERLLYKHNSLIVSDLDDEVPNIPERYYIDIEDVVSLSHDDDKIKKIAYTGCIEIEEKEIKGYVVIDDEKYEFYNKEKILVSSIPHDLGYTPVHFISPKQIDFDFIVRESVFSYVREELEDYTFLKTLQRMTEPNGAIPVVTKIEAESEDEEEGTRGDEGQPDADHIMGSQQAEIFNQNKTVGTGDLEPGTIHEIPIASLTTADGVINTDPVVNYLNFHYLPIEALTYLNDRIKELQLDIISTIVGDFLESNETAKNELQIEKSISALENTLNSLAESLNRIRKLSDTDQLSLRYGKERVKEVFIHYGTDFFLESQTKLYEDLGKAPNPIERKSILVRINQNKYKNNYEAMLRKNLLYELLPFVSDKDFNIALGREIDNITYQYQIRFNYWIGAFEAKYGDITAFYKGLDFEKAQKLDLINKLIIEIIQNNIKEYETNNSNDQQGSVA